MKSGVARTPAKQIWRVCGRSDVRRDFPFRDAHFSKTWLDDGYDVRM